MAKAVPTLGVCYLRWLPNLAAANGAALLLTFKFRDHMSVMPQLYVMTVHILLGAVLGFLIVRAIKLETLLDVAIVPDDIRPVFAHRRPLGGRLSRRLQSWGRKPLVHARGDFGLSGFADQLITLYARWERLGLLSQTLCFFC
jgi:hypothetical protein